VPTPSVQDLLADELGRLVSRLRSIGAPRLAAPSVPPFVTRADAVHHLVHELVLAAEEGQGFPERLEDVLLGDQLAVVGADALAALSSRTERASLFLLGEVVLHRFDLDGSLPKGEVARVLGDGELVGRLRARCPAL
jgi:hypothetical protein